jgi:hypothetical protein
VAGRLSSPRFRRRAAWTLGIVGLTGAIVVTSIAIGNTGHSSATKIDYSKKAWVYHEPAHAQLTKSERFTLFKTASQFVRTAVARKHLDRAWGLLGPEMRAGQTRKSWDTGFNNVVPFPADGIQQWDILYSYEGDVGMDLSLFHRGKDADNWSGKTFTIELKRNLDDPSSKWLVVSWVPKGIGGGGTLSPTRNAGPPPPGPKSAVSTKFLFLPIAFLAALLMGLAVWAIRGAVKSRRASRKYSEQLGYK